MVETLLLKFRNRKRVSHKNSGFAHDAKSIQKDRNNIIDYFQ